jgi:CRISPR-associated protein Cas1
MASHNEGCHRNSRYLRPWVDIWTDSAKSLAAARSFQETRLASLEAVAEKIEPGFDFHAIEDLCGRYRKKMKTADNTAALMGFEGDFRESLYAHMASRWRIGSFKRIQRVRARDQDDDARVRFVSRAIDHGNELACGVASLVLWILGIPGNMAVSHGHSRAGGLVCDLAASYKDAFVLPMAFALAAKADTAEPFDENLHRARVISAFDGGSRNDSRVIGIAVQAMKDAIRSAGSDVSDDDAGDAPRSPGSAPGGDQ